MRLRLSLVMRGMPWAEAFETSDTTALGLAVAMGELNGGTWEWDTMDWRKR